LKRWYGLVAEEWRLLKIYRIEHALPSIYPLERARPARLGPGLYVCGDHRATPSIQGALESGRLAAEAVIREMRGEPEPEPAGG
jgi:predicted NAD/FAD-dependent oxidoreductase